MNKRNSESENSQQVSSPTNDEKALSTIIQVEDHEQSHNTWAKEDRTLSRNWYYLGAGLLLFGIVLRYPLLVIAGLLLTIVLGTIDIWSKYCLRNVSYRRTLSTRRALFGEDLTLSVAIENAKILPLPWLEIEDALPKGLPVQDQDIRTQTSGNVFTLNCLFSLGWYDRVTRRYTLRCTTRGIHTFGPTKLHSGDVFGFITREVDLPSYQYALVYPLVVPITNFGLPARHPFGERRAPRRLLEDPSRIVGVRDYVYGDSLRRVNWKATARTLQLQSKVYEASTTYTLEIFLNTASRYDSHYGIQPELQELAICAAASIADWAIQQKYAVGLYSNGTMYRPDEPHTLYTLREDANTPSPLDESEPQHESALIAMSAQAARNNRRIRLSASSNYAQRQRMLEVLARVQPFFEVSIEELLQNERSHLSTGSTVVVITSMISDSLVDVLSRVRQSGHAISIIFIGESPLPINIAGATVYSIGGEGTWKRLLDGQNETTEEHSNSLRELRL